MKNESSAPIGHRGKTRFGVLEGLHAFQLVEMDVKGFFSHIGEVNNKL